MALTERNSRLPFAETVNLMMDLVYRHLLCNERCGSETLGRAISSGIVQNAKKV